MKSEFAVRLKRLREEKGASLQMLADLCGVSKITVVRYERGEQIPNLEKAAQMADFFGVSIDYLYGR